MEVQVLSPHGFCGGVRRAIHLAREALRKEGKAYVLGPLVHNSQARDSLGKEGAMFLDLEEKDFKGALLSVPQGSLVLFGAHGHDPALDSIAKERGLRVIDATCPFVRMNAERIRRAPSLSPGYAQKQPLRPCRSFHRRRARPSPGRKRPRPLQAEKMAPLLRGRQPVEKGHRKVAFFLIGDSRIEGKKAV